MADEKGSLDTLKFNYIKSSYFRTIRADGALGGWTPRGYLHVAFYSERQVIPQIAVYELNPEGPDVELPDQREGKEGVARELQCDVFLDESAARELRDWLNDRLKWWERFKSGSRKKNE